jgi:hypothetical protein
LIGVYLAGDGLGVDLAGESGSSERGAAQVGESGGSGGRARSACVERNGAHAGEGCSGCVVVGDLTGCTRVDGAGDSARS